MSPSEPPRFSRQTIIIAADILKSLGHTGFDRLLIEYGIHDLEAGRDLGGLLARANALANYAVINPTTKTAEGEPIAQAIVNRARQVIEETGDRPEERTKFNAALARDGFPSPSPQAATVKEELTPASERSDTKEVGAMKERRSNRIFLVHGHDDGAREAIARFLERLGLEPIILHEQANQGRTVIEKVEAQGDVGFAIILLTPDDEGCKTGGKPQPRPRQNVLLELGYFIGRLGRSRVCALKRGELELPTDFAGVVWELFDDLGGWKQKLGRELREAGFEIDWNKVMK